MTRILHRALTSTGPVLAALVPLLLASSPAAGAPVDPWRVLPLTEGADDRAVVADAAVSPLDPDRLLAWTAGLLYRSTDGGDNWAYIPARFLGEGPSPPLRNLRLDPGNADVAWASVAARVLRSTDFGSTWKQWGAPVSGDIESFETVAGDANAAWVAVASSPGGGFRKTTDGGATWLPRNEGLVAATTWAIAARPGTPGTLVAGTDDGLARTTDDGATWNWVRIGARAKQIRWDASGDVVRAYQNGLVKSTDAGLTWTFAPSEIRDGTKTYAFDPLDPAQVLLANVDWCGAAGFRYGHFGTTRRSTDGGDNWARKDLTGCMYNGYFGWSVGGAVERYGATAWAWIPQTMAVPLAFQKTTDGGDTWGSATAGMKELPVRCFDVDGAGMPYVREGYIGGSRLFRSSDRGATWSPSLGDNSAEGEASFLLASKSRPGYLLEGSWLDGTCIDMEFLARSTDAGDSWFRWEFFGGAPYRAAFGHGSGDSAYVWTADYWYDPPSATVLFRVEHDSLLCVGPSPFVPVSALITPESSSEVLAATLDAEPVVRTTDAGVSWHPRSAGLPTDTPVALLMDPSNGDHLVVAFGHGIPWESTDRGESWRRLARGPDPARADREEGLVPPELELHGVQILDADWDVVDGQRRVFLATDQGIWASDLGFLGSSRPQIAFDWIRYSRVTGLLTAASRRHGIFALDLEPLGASPGPATDAALVSTFAPLSLAPARDLRPRPRTHRRVPRTGNGRRTRLHLRSALARAESVHGDGLGPLRARESGACPRRHLRSGRETGDHARGWPARRRNACVHLVRPERCGAERGAGGLLHPAQGRGSAGDPANRSAALRGIPVRPRRGNSRSDTEGVIRST